MAIIIPAFFGLTVTVTLFVIFVSLGVKEYSPVGSISYVVLFLHLFLIFGWIIQVVIYHYLRSLLFMQFETIFVMTGRKKDVSDSRVIYDSVI